LHLLEFSLVLLEGGGEFWVVGEVAGFVGIGGDVEEFELGAVDVGIDGAGTVGGLGAFLELGLPGGGGPEVGGEGIGLVVGDVPDEFVFAVADDAHGVVHLDFVESVGGVDGVPAGGIGFGEDGDPGAAVVAGHLGAVVFAVGGFGEGEEGFGGAVGGVVGVGEVEDGGGDIDVGDHGVVGEALFLLAGIADDERDAESGLIDGGLGAGEGHAVVGGEDEDRVWPLFGFLEECDEAAEALIDAGAGLVVLGEFGAGLGGVGEEGGDDDLGGVVEDLLHALEVALVGEVAEEVGLVLAGEGFVLTSAAVGIVGAEVEEEGFFGGVGEEGFAVVGHGDGVALGAGEVLVEVEDRFGGDMVFADAGGAVAGLGHLVGEGKGGDGFEGLEFVEGVGVPVLAVVMVVEAGEDDGAAGGAGGGGGESFGEAHSLGGKGVEVGGLDDRVAVAAGDGAFVVGDEEDDIGRGGLAGFQREDQEAGEGEEAAQGHQLDRNEGGRGTLSEKEGGRAIFRAPQILR